MAARQDGDKPHPTAASGYRTTWRQRLPFPVRNLVHRWRGLLGMMLGVGIALSIGMTLLAVLEADMDLLTGDFRKSSASLYAVTEGGTLVSVLPGDTPGTISHARNVLTRVRAIPGVTAAVGIMNWSLEREHEGPRRPDEKTELMATVGVDGDPTAIPGSLVLKEGRWLRRSDEIVLGSKLSSEKGLGLGSTVRLSGRDFTVVGIGKLRGFSYSTDTLAYIDYRGLRQRADVGDVVNVIAIATDRPDEVRQRLDEIRALSIFTPDDLVKAAETVNATGVGIYWVLIVLTLSIAALFVSNVLSRSVAERRLTFATLRAIGVPTRTVLLTVGLEAIIISIVAWVLGAGLSLLLGALINVAMAAAYGFESLYSARLGVFLLVLALSLGLGLLAGFFPARRATRVDPVEVLREA